MGRQKKPTHLRVVEGDTRQRGPGALAKAIAAEPVPPGALSPAEAPDWFSKEQRASWDYALAHAPMNLLRKLDRGVLSAWCVAENLHREATVKLMATGLLVKTPSGAAMQSPFLGIINRQAVIMKALAAEMGFSPAARTRISLQEDDGAGDATDRFFGAA